MFFEIHGVRHLPVTTSPRSRVSSVGIATGYGLDGSDSIPESKVLLLTESWPTLGFAQPPIQWVPGTISPGINGRSVKLSTQSTSSEIKNCVHDIVLNYLRTGTTLQLPYAK
jgi:hypothetical protein